MEDNRGPLVFNAMMLTIFAGLSTAIGGIFVIVFGAPTFSKLGKMLSFSSGVMLYISFVDMFADASASIGFGKTNIFVNTLFFTRSFSAFFLLI